MMESKKHPRGRGGMRDMYARSEKEDAGAMEGKGEAQDLAPAGPDAPVAIPPESAGAPGGDPAAGGEGDLAALMASLPPEMLAGGGDPQIPDELANMSPEELMAILQLLQQNPELAGEGAGAAGPMPPGMMAGA